MPESVGPVCPWSSSAGKLWMPVTKTKMPINPETRLIALFSFPPPEFGVVCDMVLMGRHNHIRAICVLPKSCPLELVHKWPKYRLHIQ